MKQTILLLFITLSLSAQRYTGVKYLEPVYACQAYTDYYDNFVLYDGLLLPENCEITYDLVQDTLILSNYVLYSTEQAFEELLTLPELEGVSMRRERNNPMIQVNIGQNIGVEAPLPPTQFGTYVLAYAYYPNSTKKGQMWVNYDRLVDITNMATVILHELGHSFGIAHSQYVDCCNEQKMKCCPIMAPANYGQDAIYRDDDRAAYAEKYGDQAKCVIDRAADKCWFGFFLDLYEIRGEMFLNDITKKELKYIANELGINIDGKSRAVLINEIKKHIE